MTLKRRIQAGPGCLRPGSVKIIKFPLRAWDMPGPGDLANSLFPETHSSQFYRSLNWALRARWWISRFGRGVGQHQWPSKVGEMVRSAHCPCRGPSSAPMSNVRWLTATRTPSSGGPTPFLASVDTCIHVHTQTHTHVHVIKNLFKTTNSQFS